MLDLLTPKMFVPPPDSREVFLLESPDSREVVEEVAPPPLLPELLDLRGELSLSMTIVTWIWPMMSAVGFRMVAISPSEGFVDMEEIRRNSL